MEQDQSRKFALFNPRGVQPGILSMVADIIGEANAWPFFDKNELYVALQSKDASGKLQIDGLILNNSELTTEVARKAQDIGITAIAVVSMIQDPLQTTVLKGLYNLEVFSTMEVSNRQSDERRDFENFLKGLPRENK